MSNLDLKRKVKEKKNSFDSFAGLTENKDISKDNNISEYDNSIKSNNLNTKVISTLTTESEGKNLIRKAIGFSSTAVKSLDDIPVKKPKMRMFSMQRSLRPAIPEFFGDKNKTIEERAIEARADIKNVITTEYTGIYEKNKKNINIHKSFDLSNVGLYTKDESLNPDEFLRQYHQTRIYVEDFGGMLSHGLTSNYRTFLLSANLPESFGYTIGSTWKAPLSEFGSAQFNGFMQLASNVTGGFMPPSGINRVTSLKIWGGTEPLSLTLKIPVIDDGHINLETASGINTNMVEALEFLGALSLPSQISSYGFYQPPPSPLSVNIKYGKDKEDTLSFSTTYGRIIIQLGGILLLDNCIIENVSVDYPNTKTMIKHHYDRTMQVGNKGTEYLLPLLATVTIKITTIEAMTAQTYSKMLWLKSQKNQGAGYSDISKLFGENKNKKDNTK